ELPHLHDWLNLAFGRGRNDQPLALDLRIHRRLGAAYLASKEPARAIDQYKLALSLTPRDIFLLRACGQAQLDAKQLEAAVQTVQRITELDEQAFTHNVECAALKGRLHRRQNNLEGAADTYRRALDNHPESYYLADVLGQVLLRLDKLEEARSAYRRAGQIIDGLSERNIWTHATRATAALANRDDERVIEQLTAVARLGPSPDDIERILRGLDDVRVALGLDQSVVQRFSAVLRGG
ncbi:MAG: tetratricopeptide repeat protein, partial [Chloroflexi bacterium]|nr:tetratricopeptide repeat protein [Chloroflexota bacterium]